MKKYAPHELGRYGEKLAAKFLKKNGYRILEKNYKAGRDEIDIIAKNKTHLVFAEVKTRTESDFLHVYGRPARAVNAEKRRHIIYAARSYLRGSNSKLLPRIDIIEVYISSETRKKYRIEHITNAFGAD